MSGSRARLFAIVSIAATGFCTPAASADVTAAPEQIERYKIGLAEVKPASEEPVVLLPAVVVPARNARISVAAPFAGTVKSVAVLPGAEVQQGDPLATILSRELVEATSQLRQAEAELEASTAVADRYRTLADQRIAAPNRAAEAEAQVRRQRAVVEEHKRLLELGGIRIEPDGSYTLTAPKAGRIVEAEIGPGAQLAGMAPVLKIDTSNALWVEAQLPARLVGRVHPGDGIRIGADVRGKVLAVSHSIDPVTRSAALIGELPAGSGFVTGQMVTVSIVQPTESGVLQVPSNALAFVSGQPTVFVRTGNGFAATPVTLRGRSLETAAISGGVKPGQQVATSGLAVLENMMGAE